MVEPRSSTMSKPIQHSGRWAQRPGVEALEARQLLSSVFAHLNGGAVAPRRQETIALKVARDDFTMPRGRVLLGFAMRESGGTSGQMAMIPAGHVLQRRANPAGGATELMLASVGKGSV